MSMRCSAAANKEGGAEEKGGKAATELTIVAEKSLEMLPRWKRERKMKA